MKSLVDLLEHLLLDCGRKSGAPVHRDVETLRRRVKHEGDSFITITLPAFCSDFERSLDQGRVSPGSFTSFAKWRSGIPSFLKGFLRHVFDDRGLLLEEPSVDCIRSIRQICLFGKKVNRPCSNERVDSATESYLRCDLGVVNCFPDSWFDIFKSVARIIMQATELNEMDRILSVVPRHGPGATRERILGNQKWRFKRWHSRLLDVGFTPRAHAFGKRFLPGDEPVAEMPDIIEPKDEEPVRVVFVPKTLKTPRVIAVEPVVMQYAQQAYAALLRSELQSCYFTAGHVNFTRQGVNQELAKDGSLTGFYATLDMSEASDRVSCAHAALMFDAVPEFRKRIFACRSTRAELPDGRIINLRKFASMGSALCFPVESIIFYTSIICSRLKRAGVPPLPRHVYSYSRDVFVYGDDLIVPTYEAPAICDDLESLGFKVNRRKSFWTGKFRESCGSDCYDYEEVTPVYLRRDLPTSRGDVSGLLSAVATSNQLFAAGYYRAAAACRKAVERLLGPLPEVAADSPAIGWNYHSEVVPLQRWNPDLQRAEMHAWVAVPAKQDDRISDHAALAKSLRMVGVPNTPSDPKHLDTSPRPYSLALRRRWVPVT